MKEKNCLSVVLSCLMTLLTALWCGAALATVSPPGAPTGVAVTPGSSQAQVSFTAPASNGGSPILYYTVTATPTSGFGSVTATSVSSPITVGGLIQSGGYNFTVSATNAAGTGPTTSPVAATISPIPNSFGSSQYNVSGTIQNNSSNGTGRVYVLLWNTSYSGPSGLGTSIQQIPAGGSASFLIHGVPQGSYQVLTFLDSDDTGSLHLNDPAGMGAGFTSGSGDYYAGTTTLAAATPVQPTAIPSNSINSVTSDNAAMVMWKGPRSPYGGSGPQAEAADSYILYWGNSANPGNGSTPLGSRTVPAAGGDYHVVVSPLTQNSTVYFGIKAINSQGNLYTAMPSPVTVAAATGGATVSGRVYSTGVAKSASTPLYVALQGQSGSNFYVTSVANPTDPQTWSITGVQPDNYQVYVILDLTNSGFSTPAGYLTSNGMQGSGMPPIFQVPTGATTATAPDVTLTPQDGAAQVTTSNFGGNWYGLQFNTLGQAKRPVAVQVSSGPNLGSTIDLGLSLDSNTGGRFGGNGSLGGLSAKPQIGDVYTCSVTYSDGSTGDLHPLVTGLVTGAPMPTFPAGNTTAISSNNSLFAWQTPNPLPAGFYNYGLNLQSSSSSFSSQVWNPNMDQGFPASQLSTLYNSDGSASQGTLTSGTYSWSVMVTDGFGNQGVGSTGFTPQTGGPTVSGFTITSGTGKAGDAVTITGSGFSGATGVSFNGAPAGSFTVVNDGQINTTVPTGATVGPILVTVGGITGASSTSFPALITVSSGVVTGPSSTPVVGASVTVVGSNPPNSTTTDTSGNFSLVVPAGVPVQALIHDAVHRDTLTPIQSRNKSNNPTGFTPYTVFSDSDLPFSVASKGLVYSRVKDWDSDNPVSGVVLTAMSQLHPETPYPVYYTDPAGGSPVTGTNPVTQAPYTTAADGKFFIPNADEGDFITVSGTLAGQYILSTTYVSHTGVVSSGKVNASPLPVATANPANGNISSSQTVTLAVSNPISGANYDIWYTINGPDPTVPSGSRVKYTAPFTLPSGFAFLQFYAINTSHNVAGSVVSTNYTVSNPISAPGAPTGVSAVAGNGQATVSFTAPVSDGGSPITNYTVTSNPGNLTGTGAASPITVTGLTNGTGYSFTVTATNSAGTSLASNSSNPVIPQAQVTVATGGTGGGTVNSAPTGIACASGSSAGCSAGFTTSSVTLTATPDGASTFGGWGGDCSAFGTGPCTLNMNLDRTAFATFNQNVKARLLPAGTGFGSLQSAYSAATTGSTIAAQVYTFQENLIFNNPISVIINGGLDSLFTSNIGRTTVHGTVDISNGTVRVNYLAIY